jgi:hypothetical protein
MWKTLQESVVTTKPTPKRKSSVSQATSTSSTSTSSKEADAPVEEEEEKEKQKPISRNVETKNISSKPKKLKPTPIPENAICWCDHPKSDHAEATYFYKGMEREDDGINHKSLKRTHTRTDQ